MTELDKFRLASSIRFVLARWLFLLLGILIVGSLTMFGRESSGYSGLPIGWLMLFFVSLIVGNVLVYVISVNLAKQPNLLKTNLLAYSQVLIDLAIVTWLLFILGGVGVISAFFFLVPIVEAVVLFGFWTPFATSLLAGVILNFYALWLGTNKFDLAIGTLNSSQADNLLFSTSYSVVYILVAVLLSYNYGQARPVRVFQAYQTEAEAKDASATEQSTWIKKMNDKVESVNRALHAKELELKLARQELEKLEHAKSKFISVTTHQLRTPLSAIKWTFNMMISEQLGPVNQDQKTFLEKGYESTQRMIGIVNNLLNLDHIGTQESDLNIATIQIEELIQHIVFEFANQLESKSIKLDVKKPSKDLPAVEVDPNQMRMVIENLLDNAIKYTPKGGQVTLQIKDDRINTAQPSLEISVKDSGIGIPESEQKKIFQKFFRATNAVANEPDGSGIGLFITKDIVETHGGTMWFESVENKGTTFHLTIPLRQPKIKKQPVTADVSGDISTKV